MYRSGSARYRNTPGNLNLANGVLSFTRVDGLITRTQRIVASIPVFAVREITIEGAFRKRLVLIVDAQQVPGIPRHEFEVDDPYGWKQAIAAEILDRNQVIQPTPQQIQTTTSFVKETIREIVKIPCPYCGSLVDITWPNCGSCGAPLSKK